MSIPKSEYKVYIYIKDYYDVRLKVNEHQQTETGGSLFGLWTTSGSAVIHVVLGPGKNCRRTDQSFHQDTEYLERVGRFLKEKYMLCHIGEWHSHHCLSLDRPSTADVLGIERRFPKGMSTFLVIIANIKDRDQILLSPYFFTHDGKRYELAEFVFLESSNPFSKITPEIKQLAEATRHQPNETTLVVAIANHGGMSSRGGVNPRNKNSNPQQACSTVSAHSQASPINGRANVTTVAPQSAIIAQDQGILKEVYDELTKLLSREGKVDIERTSYGDINMIFQHGRYHWMLRFPETFPNQPAKIYRALTLRELSNCSPCRDYYIVKPLTNYANIILSIKNHCNVMLCNVCENISKEKLMKCAPAVPSVKPKLEDIIKEVKNEIAFTLEPLSRVTSEPHSDGGYRIKLDHFSQWWYIEFPAEFPDKPAELYKNENRFGAEQKKQIKLLNKSEEQLLVSPELILPAIKTACGCWTCKHKKS